MVADTGAVDRVERMIADRVADALAALATAPIDETARTALTGLGHRRHQRGGHDEQLREGGGRVRTVTGRTDRVVVVGRRAGRAGLRAAPGRQPAGR